MLFRPLLLPQRIPRLRAGCKTNPEIWAEERGYTTGARRMAHKALSGNVLHEHSPVASAACRRRLAQPACGSVVMIPRFWCVVCRGGKAGFGRPFSLLPGHAPDGPAR